MSLLISILLNNLHIQYLLSYVWAASSVKRFPGEGTRLTKIFLQKVQCNLPCTSSIGVEKEGNEIRDIGQKDWIQAVLEGGPEHFRPFVQAYGPYIYRTVFAVLQSPHDAEDVTQEVLLQIYRSLPEYRMEGWKTWITRIAVHRAIDYKRMKMRRPEMFQDSELLEGQAAAPDAETEALQRVQRQQVHALIDQLPPNYREVIAAYYIEDKSYEEIAEATGLEKKSVESRLYRARNWIKRRWRREDFE